ncbi:Proteasome subunit beta type 1 [Giardia muris]|uniref:Proteasome subunit beta n=1 Tax=Giardia muris TaxID=5742 RepID=A0A4Z1SRT3_GIAMU|nr:Proteasome subunit beta type 1 [Giardia muris]|eukprot:TNJ27695.1 Proteasome subunit beta type 1 [Giardia muris]
MTTDVVHDAEFNPYVDNGGTVVAVAGADFAMVGADTRLSEGYNVLSRDARKLHPLTSRVVLGAAGMHADVGRLVKQLRAEATGYRLKAQREIQLAQLSRVLSVGMYQRRSFPWYTATVLAGLDAEGRGAVYTYDVIGSVLRTQYSVAGSGHAIVYPIIDEALLSLNQPEEMTRERAFALITAAFEACAERDIYTGDQLVISCIDAAGIRDRVIQLRKD